jgi:hypothetical protein
MQALSTQILRHAWMPCLLLMLVAGCGYAGKNTVGEIIKEPASFEMREVKLRGTVKPLLKIPFMDSMAYHLQDSTGEIVVWTGSMPPEGEEVIVRGRVENLIIFSGQNYGLVLKEIERKPAGMKWPWQR